MININFCLFFFLCLPIVASSQKLDTSSVVAVVAFREDFGKTDDNTDYGKIMAEKAMTAIEQSRRFLVIDRTDFETVLKEFALWEGKYKDDFKKSFSDEELARYGQRLKADFIATGSISTLDAPISMVTGSYKATISFSIKFINVHTNRLYASGDFSIGSGGGVIKTFSSRGEAIAAAQGNAVEKIKLFIDKYFPIYAPYLRTEERDRRESEMEKALIGAGNNKGFRIKQKLDVILWEDQKLPPEDVGDAEIIGIQPDHSVVKITSIKRGKTLETLKDKPNTLYFRTKSE